MVLVDIWCASCFQKKTPSSVVEAAVEAYKAGVEIARQGRKRKRLEDTISKAQQELAAVEAEIVRQEKRRKIQADYAAAKTTHQPAAKAAKNKKRKKPRDA